MTQGHKMPAAAAVAEAVEDNESLVTQETGGGTLIIHQLKCLTASSLAGITARVATHPLDTFKTLLQSEDNRHPPQHPEHHQANQGGQIGPLRQLLQSDRLTLRGMYRGVGIACLFHAPALSVYLTTYDTTKELIGRKLGTDWRESAFSFLASGFCAEVVSGVFWTPMEVIKQRMQITVLQQSSSTQTAWSLAKKTLQTEGLLGLYRGYGVTLAVFVPYSMIYFLSYEKFKAWQIKRHGLTSSKDLPFTSYVLSSGLAGCIAGAAANPLDVVKTRWQLQSRQRQNQLHQTHPLIFQRHLRISESNSLNGTSLVDQNPVALARRMYRNEGISVFAKGMFARVMWIAPSVAISMSLYEFFKKFIE